MKKTWLLGLGFFSISITWGLYNAFVPFFLENYISSLALIGFMMTIDNYFAMFLQPWIGKKSDGTNTKFGKRMPFLLIGMPLAAVFGALIPWHTGLLTLIIFMMLMNLSMSLYRSPTVALMPDITLDHKRSQANGIINFMGGVGSIIAFAVGSMLFAKHESLPFAASSIVTLACMFLLLYFIKEKRDTINYVPAEKKERVSFRGEWNRPTIFLLGAIFFWFVAYQGVEALVSLYGKNQLGLTKEASAFSLTFFSLAFVAAAIPSGLLGRRFGKKLVIMIGIIGLMLVYGSINFIYSVEAFRTLLVFGGIFWAMININSYPFIVSLGKESSIGTRTGIYYLISSLAAISSPPLMGLMVDFMGYTSLFYIATGSMALALLCILGVNDKGISSSTDTKDPAASV